jgi:MSHA pilin protein MshA
MRNQKGFTMIELVVVVTILGVLAAVAIPKMVNATGSAKSATTSNLAATIKNAVSTVRSQYATSGTPVVIDGTTIALKTGGTTSGYPSVQGIQDMLDVDAADITVTPTGSTSVEFKLVNGGGTSCNVTYSVDATTGVGTVLKTITGC